MAMFDDPQKELQKLHEQLLKEEEWFEKELDSAKVLLGDAPAKKKKKPASGASAGKPGAAAAARKAPAAPAAAQQAPRAKSAAPKAAAPKAAAPEKKKGIRGLVTLAAAETLGIVGIVMYWLLVLLK